MKKGLKLFSFVAICMFFAMGSFVEIDLGNPVSDIEPLNYVRVSLKTFLDGSWEKNFETLLERKASLRAFLIHKRNEFVFSVFKSSLNPSILIDSREAFHRTDYLNVLFVSGYSASDIASWLNGLKDLDFRLSQIHTQLIILVAPSMENFRKAGLPKILQAPGPQIKVQQLQNLIMPFNQIQLVNPYNEFVKMKNPQRLYFDKDYHWNQLGGYEAVKILYRILSVREGMSPNLEIKDPEFVPFQTSELYTLKLLALEEEVHDTNWRFSSPNKEIAKVKSPILFLGDSFMESVELNLPMFFESYEHMMKFDLNYDSKRISSQHWQTIVWIISEEKLNYITSSSVLRIVHDAR